MTDFYTPIWDDTLRQARKEQLNRQYKCPLWFTRDACIIPISEMTTSHLLASFHHITTQTLQLPDLDKEMFDHWYWMISEVIKEAAKRGHTLAMPSSIEEKHSYLHAYDYLEGMSEWDYH